MAFQNLPTRLVSKSTFSMFLRTQCDRELYLSLFSDETKVLAAAGIPIPLKSRPGVQFITASGVAFENEQYDILATALPNHVTHADSGKKPVPLKAALAAVKKPTLILQPAFEPQQFRDAFFTNIGVPPKHAAIIPAFKGLRPDIIFADQRRANEYEILPSGERRRLQDGDGRMALCVIDLKNVTEANASYSAEVCLYAIFLANWLSTEGAELSKRFFVSDRVYLWRHVEMPQFTKLKATKDGQDHEKRLDALRKDLEEGLITYLIYMPNVRKFFVEDLPRVLGVGDAKGWAAVDYHVNPRCGSCDWLGNTNWLSVEDKKVFAANPTHYCFHNAETTDHLSKMPSLSRGASRVLHSGGHQTVANVVDIDASADVLRRHAFLKKDRVQIGARASAISKNAVTVDQKAKVAGLARGRNAEYDIVVNFDAGSGFLTGVAVRGILFAPYAKKFPVEGGEPVSFKSFGEAAFAINKDQLVAEWAALSSFIETLGSWMEESEKLFTAQGFGSVRTQICFWELRQYEELCNAFSRHLLEILTLPNRAQRALAWIFPADEIMEKSDAICPNIIFIREIVTASVRLPQRFAATLLGTAEHYSHARMAPRKVDNYYVEPLGNGIPRERIFEIWKTTTGTVRIFGQPKSVTEAVQRYETVLKAHTWALASITARLREDLKANIEGNAPPLNMSIPLGLQGVAYDSKLWDRWSRVSSAVVRTERLNAFLTRPEWLEASYKAIILTSLVEDLGNNQYEFEVSDDSTEAKIEEGDYCTIGIVDQPGFPLRHAASLGLTVQDDNLYVPMHTVILVLIQKFERAKKRITLRIAPRRKEFQPAFAAVMKSGVIPFGKGHLYVLEGAPYDDSPTVTSILKAIGDPGIATPAKEALIALGTTAAKKLKKGTDAVTPAADILWQGNKVASEAVRDAKAADALASFASTSNEHPLNTSQIAAVRACATQRLAIVWGPPGTGKTETLVAFLHAIVREGKVRKILLTGPNYRAVEELSLRLARNLASDQKAACDFFWLYARTRKPADIDISVPHLNLKAVNRDDASAEYAELLASIVDDQKTVIVATTAHIVDQLTRDVTDAILRPVFDLIVLDESSQVPLNLALRPLAAMRPKAQVVVAGDHKQMPPIQHLEPPKNAEYLVDSIQNYLIKRFGISPVPLLINYRSNADLVEYARSLDYPAALTAHSPKKDLRILHAMDQVIAKLPATLPSTSAYQGLLLPEKRVTALIHDDPTSSQANEVEAGLVAGLAYVLRQTMAAELDDGTQKAFTNFTDEAFFKEGLGIVTPHKAQKALVLRKLRELFPAADPEIVFSAVDTVERFQGGERNTIIVSYGVGDTEIIEGEEQFLLQLERTNVAVSRARAKCIILMPKSLAYHLPTDQKAAETSIALKSYLEEFCGKRKVLSIALGKTARTAELRWH
ncbi:DEAD/DEAH box helicase [Bradyrhizobium sp. 27S5]|uniref:DEAD/DEAH box helicase n=1 Tax=Bradyrhizobium sp. 27S5 TaxID=3139728 RepID=UPI0030D16ADD